MVGSQKKLPPIFWVQILLVLVVGLFYFLTPSSNQAGDAAAAAPLEQELIDALAPIGSVDIKEEVAEVTEPAAEVVVEAVEPEAVEINIEDVASSELGETTYKGSCFACHDTGAANSPMLSDKLSWKPRLETGVLALHNSALKGKGVMPAKGGNSALSDEAVIEAVNYMIVNVK